MSDTDKFIQKYKENKLTLNQLYKRRHELLNTRGLIDYDEANHITARIEILEKQTGICETLAQHLGIELCYHFMSAYPFINGYTTCYLIPENEANPPYHFMMIDGNNIVLQWRQFATSDGIGFIFAVSEDHNIVLLVTAESED